MKDIIILADFCGPLDGTANSRFLYLAQMLSSNSKVEIVTSDFNHGSKNYFDYEIEEHSYPITMLHEGKYSKNVCLQRFYAHYIWGRNVKKYLEKRVKPDVIYCAIPTLTAAYEAAEYCIKNNVRFVIDVQDLWPEAFQMVFHVPVVSDIIFAPLKWMANKIYSSADEIIAVSNTYCQRANSVNKKVKNTHTVFLGTDLATFDMNAKKHHVERSDNEIWLGYCGTLGHSYDLKCVMDAMVKLKEKGVLNLKFVVIGDGPLKDEFERYAKESGVNVDFTGRLPYDEMCGRLTACDIAINCIAKGSAATIINKHADYAAAGIPVLNTQESKEYKELVEQYQMGFNCRNNDSDDLAEKIMMLISDSNLRMNFGKNARICAEEKFDRNITYKKMIQSVKI